MGFFGNPKKPAIEHKFKEKEQSCQQINISSFFSSLLGVIVIYS
jgi:hypothetical protein